jgi:hypothetical protein
MKKLYKNWPVHNLIAHPISEICYWIVRPFGKNIATEVSGFIHDITIPNHVSNTGRG